MWYCNLCNQQGMTELHFRLSKLNWSYDWISNNVFPQNTTHPYRWGCRPGQSYHPQPAQWHSSCSWWCSLCFCSQNWSPSIGEAKTKPKNTTTTKNNKMFLLPVIFVYSTAFFCCCKNDFGSLHIQNHYLKYKAMLALLCYYGFPPTGISQHWW